MPVSIKESPLYRIANPRSIAFFGASNNMTAMGTSQLLSLLDLGFEGPVYPVHPTEKRVQGLRAYPAVSALPESPDLAVIVLPTRIVPEILDACGKKGIRRAIVVSGGFKEVGGRGVTLEAEVVRIARKHGIRFLGPNCIGVANPHHRLNTTFFRHEGTPGFIGMASQSGSFVTQIFNHLSRMGMGFSSAFSVGNEADIDIVDCLEYLGACPRTRVIALYIEGIKRGRKFMETARAIVPDKPIVAVYVGGTEAGRRAGFSHTGAMAGPAELYEGAFRQCGILPARSIIEMFDFCRVLGLLPPAKGRGVVIQTHSGGPGAAAADSCSRAGLELPGLSEATLRRLAPFVPHTGSLHNPVDLTFTKNPADYYEAVPDAILSGENVHVLLMYLFLPLSTVRRAIEQMGLPEDRVEKETDRFIRDQADAVARVAERHGKPVVGYTLRDLREPLFRRLMELGVPVFSGPERAARAIGALAAYSLRRRGT